MFDSKAQRDGVVAEYVRLEEALRTIGQKNQRTKESLRDARTAGVNNYFENLPRVPLSRCPFCEALHLRAFDPWGVDGLWWQHQECIVPIQEPSPCPHFRFLQGAVHFGNRTPNGGHSDAVVGPDSPFVIPRILEMNGFVAVIAQIRIGDGFTGWPIAYFSDQPTNAWDLHQEWTKTTFRFKLPNRDRVAWKIADDPWDFDLRRWLASGALQWVAPNDPEWRLKRGPDGPYLGLPPAKGVRQCKRRCVN